MCNRPFVVKAREICRKRLNLSQQERERRDAAEATDGWWNFSIGVPLPVGEGAIAIGDELSSADREYVCRLLRRQERFKNMTAQNLVWFEYLNLLRAILTEDRGLAQQAASAIADTLVQTDAEGIQRDWCFHQHGRQPQFGNYGRHYAEMMVRLASVFKGTEFAFTENQIGVLRGYLENGLRWVVWKGCFDVASMGRQCSFGATRKKAGSVQDSLDEFRNAIDPTFPREPPVGFRYFGNSAFAVCRTPNWMATVKMATTKIVGAEGICKQNVRGKLLCDGGLFVYVTGREYEDFFPLWGSWRHIPGITALDDDSPFPPWKQSFNGSDEVFGSEKDGCPFVSMRLERDGLSALKTWKFDESSILCEGKDICSRVSGPVVTTLQECWAASNAALLPAGPDGLVRAINGTVGYVIDAQPGEVRCAVETRRGDFRDVFPSTASRPVEGKVFSLLISHGDRPVDARYRYRVYPCTTVRELKGLGI